MTIRLAGVMGWPVTHSLSPHMHRFWLRKHGISGSYIPLGVQAHELSEVLRGLRGAGFLGVNVTIPHKEAAFALAHTADNMARVAEAANLLIFRNGRFDAFNTDVEGLVTSLRDALRAAPANWRAAVLGAGGAAHAAVIAADMLGAREIVVLNRTRSRAEGLVQVLSRSLRARLVAPDWQAWGSLAPGTQLIVNATSAGLNGSPSPAINVELLPSEAVVCDLVYRPLETPLLARARAHGVTPIDGLGMLMQQGARAFELLFGMRPEVSPALRCHLEQALRDGS